MQTRSTVETNFSDLSEEINSALQPEVPATPPELGQVCSTTYYDLFTNIMANREVHKGHIASLVTNIQQRNLLHLRPIDVTSTYEVIDGQHRLEAARQLGVPIYYRVTPDLSEADISILNTVAKNWRGTDYLNYWTVKGLPAYVALSRFLNQHPRFSLSTAEDLVAGNAACKMKDFREGRYVAGNYEQGVEVAKFVERIADEAQFKFAFDTRFAKAINYCVQFVEGFEPDKFMRKIALQPTALVRCATQRQYLELFEELYNYKTLQENRIRFW